MTNIDHNLIPPLPENPFLGEWEYQNEKFIIAGNPGLSGNLFAVTDTGRGPFFGFYVCYAAPVINMEIKDQPLTGVLVMNELQQQVIYWSNGHEWTKPTCTVQSSPITSTK